MGDMGEVFNDMRAYSQHKRARNREASARILREAGIAFRDTNNGVHLIVADAYDFWPGTGLWRRRGIETKNYQGRGVAGLIRAVRDLKTTCG